MIMAIDSCNGCVPPKRTPTCKFDGSCDKYSKAKAKHDQEKAISDQKKRIENGLNSQAVRGIHRSQKIAKKMKGRKT